MFLSLLCSVFNKSVNSAPRRANIKRAASTRRAGVTSSSSRASTKRASTTKVGTTKTPARTRRQAGIKVNNSPSVTASSSPSSTASSSNNSINSVSDYISASVSTSSCPVVDTETLNNILAEIKSLKEMFQSQNEKNEEKFGSLSTLISNSESHLIDLISSISGNVSVKTSSSVSNVAEDTGKIFKSVEVTLNAGQGYTLNDIVNESNLSKYSNTRFYFSKCGFVGGFKIPREECLGKNNNDCSEQPYVGNNNGASSQGYVLSEMNDKPNTSYDISNAFNPFYAVGKYYKNSYLHPSVYIRYRGDAAKKCPSYNFVKAITDDGTEELLKINIKANPINGTSGDFNFTGKVFAKPTLQLKEGETYKIKDIINFPYGAKDIYGNQMSTLYVWVSECGMDKYNGRRFVKGQLVDNQTSRGYSRVSGNADDTIVTYTDKEYESAYIKVLEGATAKCKTNFLYVDSAVSSPEMLYNDAVKIEFVDKNGKTSSSSSTSSSSNTKTSSSTTSTRYYVGGCSSYVGRSRPTIYYGGGCR
ncbi:MAG: hypothetical protein ACI4N3_01995 [Alphaproteobacteria bacterium]